MQTECGVLQGSVLLHVNDLNKCLLFMKMINFADDTKIYTKTNIGKSNYNLFMPTSGALSNVNIDLKMYIYMYIQVSLINYRWKSHLGWTCYYYEICIAYDVVRITYLHGQWAHCTLA